MFTPTNTYHPHRQPNNQQHVISNITITMASARNLQNWNEDGLAWRVARAFSEKVRKDEWTDVIESLRAQGYGFSESALRYVETIPCKCNYSHCW